MPAPAAERGGPVIDSPSLTIARETGLGHPTGSRLASLRSPKVTILGFAIAVAGGIAASALKLAGGPNPQAAAPGWR